MNPTNLSLKKPSQAWQDYGKTLSTASGTVAPKPTILNNYAPTPTSTKSSVTPSNTSATSSVTSTIAPAKVTSPAGQSYIQSQLSGIKDQALKLQSELTSSTAQNDYQNSKEYKDYLTYIRDKDNPSEGDRAQTAYQASLKSLADIQTEKEKATYDARKGENAVRDMSGGLKSGTQQGATVYNRRSTDDLNDIALRESAAARSAGVAQEAYKPFQDIEAENRKPLSFADAQALGVAYGTTMGEAKEKGLIPKAPQEEGFSLSEGQARYDAEGNLIASRGKTYAPGTGGGGTGAYVPGANPAVDSWVNLIKNGQAKITNVPANLKNAVATAISGGVGAVSETATQASTIIDELLGRDTSKITGAIDQVTGGLFGAPLYTKNLYNQLKGLLSLEKRTLLKGSGAISDYEFKVLEQAASALSRGLTDEDFRSVLAKLKVDLGTGGGMPEGDAGGQPEQLQLPDGTIVTLQADGNYE